jgi:purine-binding chemotaxis protein CheW
MAARDIVQQLVVFSLAEEEYALPITRVQEIIRYSEPRAVASGLPWIQGVISLRGKIVPVCDIATRLGLTAERSRTAKIVIVETDNGTVGVVVDDVEEVMTVGSSDLDEIPAAGAELVDAVVKVGDRLVVLLDPDGIVSGLPLAA